MNTPTLSNKEDGSNLEQYRNVLNRTRDGRTMNNKHLVVMIYVILFVSLLMFGLLLYQLSEVNEIGRTDITYRNLQVDNVGAHGNMGLIKRAGTWEFASGAGIHMIGTVSEAAGAIGAASCVAAAQSFNPTTVTLCAAGLSVYVVFQAIYRQMSLGIKHANLGPSKREEMEYVDSPLHQFTIDGVNYTHSHVLKFDAEYVSSGLKSALELLQIGDVFLHYRYINGTNNTRGSMEYNRNNMTHYVSNSAGDITDKLGEFFLGLVQANGDENKKRQEVDSDTVIYLVKWADQAQESNDYQKAATEANNNVDNDIETANADELFGTVQSRYCVQAKADGQLNILIKGEVHLDNTDGFDNDCDAQETIE